MADASAVLSLVRLCVCGLVHARAGLLKPCILREDFFATFFVMSDPFQLAVMPDDLTDGLQALVELVAEIDYWARLSVTHGQQCRSLADFCDNVVDQLEVNANECITTFTGEEREHHMDCYREYIAQTKYGLEQALGQVREISERREIDALADPYKTVSSIVGCCVALADCASRFAITSQLGLLEWVKELAIAAKADQTMLVDIVSREHDVITCMRLLQVRMRAFDQESEECRKAEETLRNLQRKVDMPLLPLADLVLEAREIDGAPVGNSTTAQIRKGDEVSSKGRDRPQCTASEYHAVVWCVLYENHVPRVPLDE